jgi:serine protease Do
MDSRLRSTIISVVAWTLFFCSLRPIALADVSSSALASTYAMLKPSLALVAYEEGKNLYTGSSFCINSSGGWSYFLTNAHVVGSRDTVAVFLSSAPGKAFTGTVLRVNGDLDAAIVAVHTPNIPSATIGIDTLPEGQQIAIAGYPSAHIDFALLGLGLTPSVHEGIVTSYPGDGAFLEFDAQVEHGNSGGPVFDPDTGLVYGIVTLKVGSDQTNLAVSTSQLLTFIQNAHVSVNQSTRKSALAQARPRGPAIAETSAATPKLEHEVFNTYIPLRNQDQAYDCGNGLQMVMGIKAYDLDGNYKVTYDFSCASNQVSPVSYLQAHDQYDNITLSGYFSTDGSLQCASHRYSDQTI